MLDYVYLKYFAKFTKTVNDYKKCTNKKLENINKTFFNNNFKPINKLVKTNLNFNTKRPWSFGQF